MATCVVCLDQRYLDFVSELVADSPERMVVYCVSQFPLSMVVLVQTKLAWRRLDCLAQHQSRNLHHRHILLQQLLLQLFRCSNPSLLQSRARRLWEVEWYHTTDQSIWSCERCTYQP